MGFLNKLTEKETESNEKIKKCSKKSDDKIGQFSLNDKKKEIEELNNLLYDEVCNYIISGVTFKNSQIIAITSQRIIFLHKGLRGSLKMKDIYIDDIKCLKSEKGIAFGKIKILLDDEDVAIDNVGKQFIEETVHFINEVKINEIISKNDISYEEAKRLLENKYREFEHFKIKEKEINKQEEKKRRENERLKSISAMAIKKHEEEKYESVRIEQLKKEHIPYCPKCHSTALTYQNKKLSIGRAIVGDALAGPVGGVLGGLTSKKGYVKCLNCGHEWKI